MANCNYFIAYHAGDRVNCANCKRWNGEKCKVGHLLTTPYDESKEFEFYDRMMWKNKGVHGPL